MTDKPKKWDDLDRSIRDLALEWYELYRDESHFPLWKRIATAEMRAEINALMLRHLRAFFAPYELPMRFVQKKEKKERMSPWGMRAGIDQIPLDTVMAVMQTAKYYCPTEKFGWRSVVHKFPVDGRVFNWIPMRSTAIDRLVGVKQVICGPIVYEGNEPKTIPIVEKCCTVQLFPTDGVTEMEVVGQEFCLLICD